MTQVEQKFQVGNQVDYIDPATRQWVGPVEIVEILWCNTFQMFLYIIDSEERASCCCDAELRLRGSGDTSSSVEDL